MCFSRTGAAAAASAPATNYVAHALREACVGTLLFDLLTAEEERLDEETRGLRFDIPLLTRRLIAATHWAQARPELTDLALGYFGASTGAAAALCAAACTPAVRAVVSRGGRPDLAGSALAAVRAPTLLVVGGDDEEVLALNRRALAPAWNPKAERVYGYSEAKALRMKVQQLIPREAQDAHEKLVQHLAQGESPSPLETTRITKDGRALSVWLTASLLVDSDGKPTGVATTERELKGNARQSAD